MQIVPFENARLPAFLAKVDQTKLNDDLTSHAGAGFPNVSIKGKVFTIVRAGVRETLMNPLDPTSPASNIDVVLVKASPVKSKQFYLKGWEEGQDAERPDCWSNDSITPDATVEHKQSPNCAVCRHNQWGTKIGDKGATKGKACQDSVRLAIATPALIAEPFMLRVPPASIKALGEYGEALKKRGVGYNMVVTKISFDVEVATPKLIFKPVGFLDEAGYNEVQEIAATEVVRKIMGIVNPAPAEAAPAPDNVVPIKPAPDPVPVVFETVTPIKAKEVKEAKKGKVVTEAEVVAAVGTVEQAEVAVDMEGIDLSSLNFDD